MPISDLVTSGENLFSAISGDQVSDKVKSNISDGTAIVALGLSILQRNTTFNVDGVVTGATQTLNGLTATITAVKTPVASSAVTHAIAGGA
ncbi:hypothetical protein [Gluconobacter kondonii]|uniref:hypothetical protein n=1 Tax=Gluconobacter kondonii TaxID=941463 RepID=UPI001B8D2060|nr:hypothetical protein [Gluconobacter kondonii]MBS1065941.1 hypothetical protein [Gluconobacter kondonii]MBS1082323.1 hypothetical protein [Gluconobacter kondonii]